MADGFCRESSVSGFSDRTLPNAQRIEHDPRVRTALLNQCDFVKLKPEWHRDRREPPVLVTRRA